MIKYQAKIFKDGKNYSVIFPDLPGCFASGRSKDDARYNAREALSLYLEEARDPLWKIPEIKARSSSNYEWVSPSYDVAIPLMIRKARLSANLSQTALAKKLSISVQQLQKLETPGKSNPTVKTLAAISRALGGVVEIKLAA